MDTSKQILEKEKRLSKSKEISFLFTKNYFKVLDENNFPKYVGRIDPNGIYNSCSCPSFYFGMKYAKPNEQTVPFTSLYFAEHGHTFHCKHILGAMK